MTKIEQVLREGFPRVESRFTNLNRGGCLLFANNLMHVLADKGYKSRVVVLGMNCDLFIKDFGKGKGINTAYRNACKEDKESFPHCGILYKGNVYDSSGIVYEGDHSKPLTQGVIDLLLSDVNRWNPAFWLYNSAIKNKNEVMQILIKKTLDSNNV